MSVLVRADAKTGTLSADLSNVATSITNAGFAGLPAVASGSVLKVVLDPEATAGAPEIVYVTAHTALSSTATIARGQEGSTARSHLAGVRWDHAPTAFDFFNRGSGTYAQMVALSSPRLGERFITTDQLNAEYIYNGSRWRLAFLGPGQFAPIEYGADPTGIADSRAAIVAAITAANTAIQSGGPVADGNTYGEVVFTAGQYLSSSSITLPNPGAFKMRGIGGASTAFQWGHRVPIVFSSGGFVLSTSQSNAVDWEGLAVYGAPALKIDRGQGPGQVTDCLFRSIGAGQAAVEIINAFWGDCDRTTFQAVDTSTPSILIRSDSALGGGMEGWLYRWSECRFVNAGIRWDINGTHSTVIGACTVLDACDTENFTSGAAGALLRIRNIHATQSSTADDVEIRSCSHNDGGGDLLCIETVGSGSLVVGSVSIVNSFPNNSAYHVRHLETGGGGAHAERLFIKTKSNPLVLLGSAGGYGYMFQQSGSGWLYVGDRATSGALSVRVNGASSLYTLRADGVQALGEQASDPTAPGANTALLYARDNGSGKTQIVARFPTGAVQVIATEP